MKFKMVVAFIPFAFLNLALSADFLQNLKLIEHEHKGCPLNSICSKSSGKLLARWEKYLAETSDSKKVKRLEKFQKTDGLPLEFLTTIDSKLALDPILWNSRCKIHNPKNPHNKVYRGLKFFKRITPSEHTIFTKVWLYIGEKKMEYLIPYGDQIIMIQNDQLILLKEYDDFYYQISVAANGLIQVKGFSHKTINQALDKKVNEFACPTQESFKDKYFTHTYCQKVLDIDSNDLKIIQYTYSCP